VVGSVDTPDTVDIESPGTSPNRHDGHQLPAATVTTDRQQLGPRRRAQHGMEMENGSDESPGRIPAVTTDRQERRLPDATVTTDREQLGPRRRPQHRWTMATTNSMNASQRRQLASIWVTKVTEKFRSTETEPNKHQSRSPDFTFGFNHQHVTSRRSTRPI
jgi:hypothetical protein